MYYLILQAEQQYCSMYLFCNFRSLEERAARLFSTKGKRKDEWDQSMLTVRKEKSTVATASELQKMKQIAFLEAQCYFLIELLGVGLSLPSADNLIYCNFYDRWTL